MNTLLINLELLEPVLVMDAGGGDPNSAASLRFLPGSALRGACIRLFLKNQACDIKDEPFHSLFFSSQVRFLHAYPLGKTGLRMLPTPRSWRTWKEAKSDADPIYDIAVDPESGKPVPLKSIQKPFCQIVDSDQYELLDPDVQTNLHIARSDRQRVVGKAGSETASQIFRYQALAPGQVFQAAIQSEDTGLLEKLSTLLPMSTQFRLGKSHMAGYGLVEIVRAVTRDDWSEYIPSKIPKDSWLILTMLSDTLLRHPVSGAYTLDLDPVIMVHPSRTFTASTIVSGFNRTWNLPLPQAQAIKAGSVYVYPFDTALKLRLENLVATGLGERVNEGWGRLALDWQTAGTLKKINLESKKPKLAKTLEGSSAQIAQGMAERLMRRQLDLEVAAWLNSKTLNDAPTKTQLSRLRTVVRKAQAMNDPQYVLTLLSTMKKTGREQFHKAHLGNQKFDDWIQEICSSPGSVWNKLNLSEKEQITIGGQKPDLLALANEYALRLVDGVCYRAGK